MLTSNGRCRSVRLAFCSSVLALSVFAVSCGSRHQELVVQEPTSGTLMIGQEALHLQTDHWIYVDSRLVARTKCPKELSANCHSPGEAFVRETSSRDSTDVSFYDAKTGQAIGRTRGGRWIQSKDNVYPVVHTLTLAPGRHQVEVATRVIRWLDTGPVDLRTGSTMLGKFPFVIAGKQVEVQPGTDTANACLVNFDQDYLSIDFGPNNRIHDLQLASVSTEAGLTRLERQFDRRFKDSIRNMSEDPVLEALEGAERSNSDTPAMWVNLPKEYGGRREVDADQLMDIVDWAREQHWSWGLELGHHNFLLAGQEGMTARADRMTELIVRARETFNDHYREGMAARIKRGRK